MAFIRAEKKKSGTYLRIIQSYKEDGKSKHKTLYSLGKVEDYSADQLEKMAKKLLKLAGRNYEELLGESFKELGRYNYGYGLVLSKLWDVFNVPNLVKRINKKRRVKFNWQQCLGLMLAERINDPCSKLASYSNQNEYLGLQKEAVKLHHFYRTLDILSAAEDLVKKHFFTQRRNLFSTVLDVVFYDVTTLYFDSQVEAEGSLRQKGYCKDGKAHKTQVVLGLLVDKLRNPITYQVYEGNTYEGRTMIDALQKMKKQFTIDKVVVVADTAMIDKENRDFMVDSKIDYIIGDSIKNLGKVIRTKLIDKTKHKSLNDLPLEIFSYTEEKYKGRRIICTYSLKRAKKDAHQRQKLIDKAEKWLENPSKYKQVKKRGAGRFIKNTEDGDAIELNKQKIEEDAIYDGFKAFSTTTDLSIEDVLSKYKDLFEVEHSFRALKSQLEIRPMFHWTNERIKGHICMCFIAFTFLNHLKNTTQLQYRAIVKALDKMQLSLIEDTKANTSIYLRSKIDDDQKVLIEKMKLKVPNDTCPQNTVNQCFIK